VAQPGVAPALVSDCTELDGAGEPIGCHAAERTSGDLAGCVRNTARDRGSLPASRGAAVTGMESGGSAFLLVSRRGGEPRRRGNPCSGGGKMSDGGQAHGTELSDTGSAGGDLCVFWG